MWWETSFGGQMGSKETKTYVSPCQGGCRLRWILGQLRWICHYSILFHMVPREPSNTGTQAGLMPHQANKRSRH